MTDTVASQAAYVVLQVPDGPQVASQAAYVVLQVPNGPQVASMTAYVVLINIGRNPLNRSQAMMGTF